MSHAFHAAWTAVLDALSGWREDHAAQRVGEGIVRHRDPHDADRPLPPSLALASVPPALGPAGHEARVRPRFNHHHGVAAIHVPVPHGTSLYGTGEVCGPLLRNGRSVVLWNTDSFEYTDKNQSLYQSHPWVLGVRADGTAFGVLFDTFARSRIDLDGTIGIRAEGASPPVYVIDRASPADVLRGLAELTGTMPMPPRWALGYHQSRWSYEPASRVREVAREFRARRIPCDAIWLDIDYMHGFRCFTFDPDKFPDPGALTRDLDALGFRTVWMIDPGIKVDDSYWVYREGRDGGHFIRSPQGGDFVGEVWPGACSFPDFTSARTRDWWAGLYRDFLRAGVAGVWNDMNEPAVFDRPGKHMPEDTLHHADPDLGGPGPHARYHNVYGMLMVRATRQGVERERPNERPFVLTRANFLGGHRYAATWTGDNQSTWEHLAWSIPMVLNLGLSGQPFCGPDIGGFSGDATPALFARWMGIGAMLPFARGHSIKGSADHEPWSFGPACEATCRRALERRYRLLPYFYTLFRVAHATGLPIARPLFFADPADPRLRDADDAFLLGDDLLVRCRVTETGDCRAPFPNPGPDGPAFVRWRPEEHDDPDLPELWVRRGAIIPLGPVMPHADERPLDPLTLLVCPRRGEGEAARGELYEDAGQGHAHVHGEFLRTTFSASASGGRVIVRPAACAGRWPPPARTVLVESLDPALPGGFEPGAWEPRARTG